MRPSKNQPIVAGVVLVLLVAVPGASPTAASPPIEIDRYIVVLDDVGAVDVTGAVAAGGGRLVSVVEEGGFAIVEGLTAASAATLRRVPGVMAVEPDAVIDVADDELAGGDAFSAAGTLYEAGKPVFGDRQWNLVAIKADRAQEQGYHGDPSVRVAVIDTGIDYTHPDLEGLVDLSENGSVSLLSMSCQPGEPGTPGLKDEIARAEADGLEEFVDYHSHGTAVAGLVASNGEWLAAVSERTTLIAIKVNARTSMRQNCVSVYIAAIYEAIERDADVIHLSFPVEFTTTLFPGTVELINRAMTDAHRSGAVIVAAAGNTGALVDPESTQFRFCNADHVLCASGTAPTAAASSMGPWEGSDTFWPLSNFGPAIDVAGPAGTTSVAHSAVWLHCSLHAIAPGRPCTESGRVWSSTGTSFAAAATSGLVAQLVAVVGPDKPGKVTAIIRATARDLGDPDWDPLYGDGFVDVERALALATRASK